MQNQSQPLNSPHNKKVIKKIIIGTSIIILILSLIQVFSSIYTRSILLSVNLETPKNHALKTFFSDFQISKITAPFKPAKNTQPSENISIDKATSQDKNIDQNQTTRYSFVATISGQSALEGLNQIAEVQTKDFADLGSFINSINNLESNNQFFWAFYLNDELATQASDKTILQIGDKVDFIYEKINF